MKKLGVKPTIFVFVSVPDLWFFKDFIAFKPLISPNTYFLHLLFLHCLIRWTSGYTLMTKWEVLQTKGKNFMTRQKVARVFVSYF